MIEHSVAAIHVSYFEHISARSHVHKFVTNTNIRYEHRFVMYTKYTTVFVCLVQFSL